MKVKRSFLVMVALGLALCLTGAPAWGDDFYVIAGGGPSGKVLKTQVFTSDTTNNTLGTDTWAKLDSPQWTYTKLSPTSYLVITYQDSISSTGGWGFYQLRVNDLASVAGINAALLVASPTWNIYGATGVWSGLPKGEVNLSIWHWQSGCSACAQGANGWTTNVVVMEIEH
ncbi:MAG: hypothetical protein KKD99_04605 [Proteobacteria bacterium]|nr:hypothetical protein [Pseudomonadota bacterium]MBU4354244.1 hypothetical protein [Pseudomonadota bacterium]MBU4447850.1 hypothetical protein [Pseudomonadota bacterium]MCG2772860.1 hypothetical protein [Desulfobacterales bacterium]